LYLFSFLFIIGCNQPIEKEKEASFLIEGYLSGLSNDIVYLEGFDGFSTYRIDSIAVQENGYFQLRYDITDKGVGYLISSDAKPFFIILSGEKVLIEGESLSSIAKLKIKEGQENKWFEQYAKEQPIKEQAMNAWVYLSDLYKSNDVFTKSNSSLNSIEQEINRLNREETEFLANLPENSYAKWFLPLRKLAGSITNVAQNRQSQIPDVLNRLREINYADEKIYKSGLYRDLVEQHFWLIENSGQPLDSVYVQMTISIDRLIRSLRTDERKLNVTSDFLFDYLEKRSLFNASEYLALKILNQESCTINSDLANQLETYRAMKKGAIAPDLIFSGDVVVSGAFSRVMPKRLSDFRSNYTLVVYAASWCPKCTEEIPKLNNHYKKWKYKGVDVVLLSLDSDTLAFANFVKNSPFVSVCDYKKWESPLVKNYYVFATPTMFLLSKKREILLRPMSVEQVDAWVDWYLK
jgi:peroxiredoxin